ncbi:MAG: hypothetical protein LBS90_01855 [Oscillospiraceae bacterium]|jgi:uroporphyrinogen-III decarboxylase|nr:hypothetical protein [Oscillospiraceae bacterium]
MPKSKLSPGENFMRIVRGEIPDYVPIYTMGFPGLGGETAVKIIGPSLFDETHLKPAPTGRRDVWGVNYIANEETNFACIPEPNNFLLDDITKWRDVIKAPELPANLDWERLAKADIADAELDRSQSAAMAAIGLMPFQQLIAFMGFTGGLMAVAEEPEEVEALLHFMTDLYVPVVEKTVEYYAPDMLYLLDDTAAARFPFVSPDFFTNVLKPVYARLTKPAAERGIPVQLHNCGRCEDFLDDMYDVGTRVWDPAQLGNDIHAAKAKYKGKISVAGAFSWTPHEDYTEEEVRAAVRACIDEYAPDGGFAFFGGILSRFGDRSLDNAVAWMNDEAYNYGRDYYLK